MNRALKRLNVDAPSAAKPMGKTGGYDPYLGTMFKYVCKYATVNWIKFAFMPNGV